MDKEKTFAIKQQILAKEAEFIIATQTVKKQKQQRQYGIGGITGAIAFILLSNYLGMDILTAFSIVLFIAGIVFLFLGYRGKKKSITNLNTLKYKIKELKSALIDAQYS